MSAYKKEKRKPKLFYRLRYYFGPPSSNLSSFIYTSFSSVRKIDPKGTITRGMFPYKNIFIFPREWKIKQQRNLPPQKTKVCVCQYGDCPSLMAFGVCVCVRIENA